ncbi:hypothetical protein FACS189468_1800 [Spirochaetia bacterium]|nr:hypothetical protein FACS189468_1800 [Spirochaetia bacterium]
MNKEFVNKTVLPGVRSKNQQAEAPLAHYRALYETLDPEEIARRCGLAFDKDAGYFSLRLMGTEYRAAFPEFEVWEPSQQAAAQQIMGVPGLNPYEQILIIRYLCEGKYFEAQGKRLSYNEIPWGPVYYRNFEGRCLKRLAFAFGNDLGSFRRIMEEWSALGAIPLDQGDAAYHASYRFEFLNGLFISLLLWAGDDEFPPSAQILFDDNFVFAFTAEDLAAVGEVVIDRLKKRRT